MSSDRVFMRAALRLARKGVGRTSPNPPVGAVLARRGRMIAGGYHRRAGEAHAEVVALREAGRRARGATLYVTLEPCSHQGRTPPCCGAVIEAGVGRVVVGVKDPNPLVCGRGIRRMRRAGIEVEVGVEEECCRELLGPFAKHVTTGLPLVILKLAATLDGRIATAGGESRWITGEKARRFVHRTRNEVDAVMVGAGTVLADNPRLTCRVRGGRDPVRVVVDGRLRLSLDARVVSGAEAAGTLVVTGVRQGAKIEALRRAGVDVVRLPARDGIVSMKRVLALLGRRGIMSVMIEGGGRLAAAVLRARLVDRVDCFVAPKLIGSDGVPMMGALGVKRLRGAPVLHGLRVTRLGDDILLQGCPGGPDGV